MTEGEPKRPNPRQHKGRILPALAVVSTLVTPGTVQAREPQTSGWVGRVEKTKTPEAPTLSPVMRVKGDAVPPTDFVNYCVRHPEECAPFPGSEHDRMQREQLDDFRRLELGDVNTEVNALPQVSDLERFGRTEHWTVADSRGGDCEDLAALKKRILQHVRGFKPNNLLLAHVVTDQQEGHIVLLVRTRDGDYILDNKRGEIALWSEYATRHGYTFLSRQSYLDPQVWLKALPLEQQK